MVHMAIWLSYGCHMVVIWLQFVPSSCQFSISCVFNRRVTCVVRDVHLLHALHHISPTAVGNHRESWEANCYDNSTRLVDYGSLD